MNSAEGSIMHLNDVIGGQQPEFIDYVIAYSANCDHKETQIVEIWKSELEKRDLNITERYSRKNKMNFMILTAKREALTKRAELIKLTVPIRFCEVSKMMSTDPPDLSEEQNEQVQRLPEQDVSILNFIRGFVSPSLEGGHIKFHFSRQYDKRLYYKGDKPSKDDIFTNSTKIRSLLVHDIIKDIELTSRLRRSSLGSEVENDEHCSPYRGLEWLKIKGIVKKSFIPHSKEDLGKFELQRRKKHAKFPIHAVTALRNYFGEKIGFAFAWRAAWLSYGLAIPAIIGLLFFIINAILFLFLHKEVLPGFNNSTSVPQNNIVLGMLNFDTALLPPYSILALLLQILGLFYGWSLYHYTYSFKWGMLNFFLTHERRLVMYKSLQDLKKRHKLMQRMLSFVVGIFVLGGIAIFNFAILILQQMLKIALIEQWSVDEFWAAYLTTIVASLFNTVVVVICLNRRFISIAKWLCSKECHSFPSDFERHFTWKVFIYTFISNNMRLFLMVFSPTVDFGISVPSVSKPGETFKADFCEEGRCVSTIAIQLIFFLVFKPFTSYMGYRKDDIFRWISDKLTWLTCSPTGRILLGERDSDELVTRMEDEYLLYESDKFGERNQTLMDLNDKVAQYGFVLMYGGVCPLSPLIATCMEILCRTNDIIRYTKQQRRAVPRRYEGVGCWDEIIELINVLAIITNIWISFYRSTAVTLNHDQIGLSLAGGLLVFVHFVKLLMQGNSVPEKVRRFQHVEFDAVDVVLNHTDYFREGQHNNHPDTARSNSLGPGV